MEQEQVQGKLYDGQLLRRLAFYIKPYRKQVAATVVLLSIHSLLESVGPILTAIAIDRYLVQRAPGAVEGIAQLSLVLLGVSILILLAEFGQALLMQSTGQRAMFALRRDLMAQLHRLDIAYFDKHPVGRLVTRVTNDVDTLNELFSSGLVAILGDAIMLTWLLGVLLWMSPGLTVILLAVTPLVYWATMTFRAQVSASYRRIRLAVARINAFLSEHISGIAVLQAFNREQAARDDFAAINREHMVAFKQSVFAYGWFYPVVEFLSMLAFAAILVYGGWQVPRGTLSLGVLIAFFQFALRFFRPIQDLSEKYNILQSATTASERIFELLDTVPTIAAPADPVPVPDDLTIVFDHVWFAYTAEDWVLRDVSFSIAPGEAIAIVGHTGAGKTTITNLLLRFYDVQRGHISIGGVNIQHFDPLALRRRFAIVLQDPYLFTGTIGSNISLDTPGIDEAKLTAAAAQVNLLDFIEKLPGRFQEPILERGSNLSTGQKQLVSFARALVHEPKILILDEATSSVETDTELLIRDAQKRLLRGRTSISIAHRLSTIQNADRIFAFHKGQLREAGSHAELIQQRGLYWKLFQLQYQEL
ncbi:MAG: ABC transporter ATP-binding protein [Acidobacteria bacterium]|nr:ABC transporter ATP-binding protein [Acidobacteriota bacterium]